MKNVKITRRSFLLGLGAASSALLLSACNTVPASSDSGAAPSQPDSEAPASSAASEMPAQPILSVDEFPITDGSTACIPLIAQIMADTTGLDLETAESIRLKPAEGKDSRLQSVKPSCCASREELPQLSGQVNLTTGRAEVGYDPKKRDVVLGFVRHDHDSQGREVLENKAQRLKVLTEDVVEASKASTGNIALEMTDLNFIELVHQVIGEFEEKFEERKLQMIVHFDEEEAIICADGRRLWRVLENVFGNTAKYAMENTRVYVDVSVNRPNVQLSLKNISAQPLNITADELTERFIRGDVSRNTEGSGLGLSIAKDLVQLQGGTFNLYLDGDLFKVTIEFKMK